MSLFCCRDVANSSFPVVFKIEVAVAVPTQAATRAIPCVNYKPRNAHNSQAAGATLRCVRWGRTLSGLSALAVNPHCGQ